MKVVHGRAGSRHISRRHGLDDLVGDREPQPEPFFPGGVKGLKEMLDLLLGIPTPSSRSGSLSRRNLLHGDADPASPRHGLAAVGKEIDEDLLQLIRITVDLPHVPAVASHECVFIRGVDPAHDLDHVLDDGRQVCGPLDKPIGLGEVSKAETSLSVSSPPPGSCPSLRRPFPL